MAHGASRPTVSRRREIGGASARSLLMTILGEFVLPRGGSPYRAGRDPPSRACVAGTCARAATL